MALDHERFARPTRRDFLKVVGGGAGAALAAGTAYAHHHPVPMPQSVQYLDRRSYIHNMELIAHFLPGQERSGGMGMMTVGEQRLIFQQGDIIDVSDPRNPKMLNKGGGPQAFAGQVGYHTQLKKWLMMQSSEVESAQIHHHSPGGKYDDPATAINTFRNSKNLRGIRMWDISDPMKPVKMSEFTTGPTGSGSHGDGDFWDGGKYAYLAGAPDDTFTHSLGPTRLVSDILMILDVSDPTNVKHVSNWWVPGQRNTEVDSFKKWQMVQGHLPAALESTKTIEAAVKSFKGMVNYPGYDRFPYACNHGPICVPTRVEDGGKLGFGSWAAFGFLIHDFSDITKPKLIGRFDPTPTYGLDGIPFHNIWGGMLDRGFVVTVPEPMNPDCNETYLPSWVVDVRNPANPIPIAQLPRPKPPADAPYADFCFARGRFGAHGTPANQGPGRASQTFLPLPFFNAGIQCFDLTEPTNPEIVGYFIPPHAGTLSPECRVNPLGLEGKAREDCIEESNTYNRPTDMAFVEWDRKLIYACTTSGVYILSCPALGKPILHPMAVREWSMPGVNVGAPGAR